VRLTFLLLHLSLPFSFIIRPFKADKFISFHFRRRILDAIDTENATPRDRGTAYVYAVLMLLCAVLKVSSFSPSC
jgi:hypothetical protein